MLWPRTRTVRRQRVFCLLYQPWKRPIRLQIVELKCRLCAWRALRSKPSSHVLSPFAQIYHTTTERAFCTRLASTGQSQHFASVLGSGVYFVLVVWASRVSFDTDVANCHGSEISRTTGIIGPWLLIVPKTQIVTNIGYYMGLLITN